MISNNSVTEFMRSVYIKDLFHAKQVIPAFDILEFESLVAFKNAIKGGFYSINTEKEIVLNLSCVEEFEMIKELMQNTEICEFNKVSIGIPNSIIVECMKHIPGVECKKFQIIIIDDENTLSLNDLCRNIEAKEYLSNNACWIKIRLNKDNFINKCSKIPYYYVNGLLRFFKLEFDYESFTSLTLKELNALEFWLYHINVWVDQGKKNDVIIIDDSRKLVKPIFIANDLKIYFSAEHKKCSPDTPLSDLYQDEEKTGEDLGFKEMSMLRRYLDVTEEFVFQDFVPSVLNYKLINWYQNLAINKELIEIPHITTMVMNWIGLRVIK